MKLFKNIAVFGVVVLALGSGVAFGDEATVPLAGGSAPVTQVATATATPMNPCHSVSTADLTSLTKPADTGSQKGQTNSAVSGVGGS